MRILFTNGKLDNIAGTETYGYALVEELHRRGHEIDVFSFNNGYVARKMSKFAAIIDDFQPKYDLMLVNHNNCHKLLLDRSINGTLIRTYHGIYPPSEKPKHKADFNVAVSEETQNFLSQSGFESEIIRNGVNCERFSPISPIRPEIKRVLSLVRSTKGNQILKKVCDKMDLELEIFAKSKERAWDIEKNINNSDLVVTIARGVLDAMACGRAVLVCDMRFYSEHKTCDGMVLPKTINEMVKNNCTGRRFRKRWNSRTVRKNFGLYNQEMGEFNRQYALKHFNIKKQVDKYFDLLVNS